MSGYEINVLLTVGIISIAYFGLFFIYEKIFIK